MAKIRLQTTENMAEIFGDFLISRKTKGVADKTLESYSYHFHAISKHLDTTKEMAMLQKADLEEMIASMRDAGLAANTIQSYTRTLKSYFSWCNEESMVFRWFLTIRVQKSVILVSNINSSVVADNPRAVSDNLGLSSSPFSLRRGGIWITPFDS